MNSGSPTASEIPAPLKAPLLKVEQQIIAHQSAVESWFRSEWKKTPAPFYSSVDLRNSGYKIAPVDTNLFPAGFNNLNPDLEAICIQSLQLAVERLGKKIDRILFVPENHTRNLFYLENVNVLMSLIAKAGFEVMIGSLIPGLESAQKIELESGATLTLNPMQREGDVLSIAGFTPDLILLNNDLSGGRPAILENLRQPVVPSLSLGWSSRLKSVHFGHYRDIAKEFSELIGIDPWFIDPLFRNCGEIDFMKKESNQCLVNHVNTLLMEIRNKYKEYGVDQAPYVVVKADAGTYGMGVMMAHSAEELLDMNRKERTRMSTTKEGQKVTKVIIQEGVYTNETWGADKRVAESVVYMIDKNVVGGFYRVHAAKGVNENLNSPGMQFERFAFGDCCVSPDKARSPDAEPNRFYTYGVIARLASLAAAREATQA